MKIYLIRHAETLYNADLSYLYTNDVPLTPYGCLQASLLTGHYDVVIVSPLKRTQMTFEHSQIIGDSVYVEPRVREHIAYQCDRQVEENIELETEHDVKRRCSQFRDYLRLTYTNQRICIVTHTNWIKFFLEINGYELLGDCLGNCQMITIDL